MCVHLNMSTVLIKSIYKHKETRANKHVMYHKCTLTITDAYLIHGGDGHVFGDIMGAQCENNLGGALAEKQAAPAAFLSNQRAHSLTIR